MAGDGRRCRRVLVAKLRVPWAGSGCRRDEWRPIAPSAVMLGPNAMYRLQAVTAHPCDPEPICRSSTAPYRTMTSLSANVRGESPDGSVTGRIVIVLRRTASSAARRIPRPRACHGPEDHEMITVRIATVTRAAAAAAGWTTPPGVVCWVPRGRPRRVAGHHRAHGGGGRGGRAQRVDRGGPGGRRSVAGRTRGVAARRPVRPRVARARRLAQRRGRVPVLAPRGGGRRPRPPG